MSPSDDRSGEDADIDEFEQGFLRHRQDLYQRISEFMDETELDEAYAADLLLDAAVSMRMTAYALGVESPSATGLKLDLDRLRRDVDDLVRQQKRDAESYIEDVKQARAEAEAEVDGK